MCSVQAHCLTRSIHDIDLLTLDAESVAEVSFFVHHVTVMVMRPCLCRFGKTKYLIV